MRGARLPCLAFSHGCKPVAGTAERGRKGPPPESPSPGRQGRREVVQAQEITAGERRTQWALGRLISIGYLSCGLPSGVAGRWISRAGGTQTGSLGLDFRRECAGSWVPQDASFCPGSKCYCSCAASLRSTLRPPRLRHPLEPDGGIRGRVRFKLGKLARRGCKVETILRGYRRRPVIGSRGDAGATGSRYARRN